MVNDAPDIEKVVRYEDGPQTGDRIKVTADGRRWVEWDGIERTGQELKLLIG